MSSLSPVGHRGEWPRVLPRYPVLKVPAAASPVGCGPRGKEIYCHPEGPGARGIFEHTFPTHLLPWANHTLPQKCTVLLYAGVLHLYRAADRRAYMTSYQYLLDVTGACEEIQRFSAFPYARLMPLPSHLPRLSLVPFYLYLCKGAPGGAPWYRCMQRICPTCRQP